MFYGREKELNDFNAFLNSKHTAAVIFGKRRVGKSTLILESLRRAEVRYIYYECMKASPAANLEAVTKVIRKETSNKFISFENWPDVFEYLGTLHENIVMVIDEYPYLKEPLHLAGRKQLDSMFQSIIDQMPSNVKLILSGSWISMMKEILEEDNPLYGRFSRIMDLKPFDYYDSASFYSDASLRSKFELYAVFGGFPYVNSYLDPSKSLRQNITEQILSPGGVARNYIERIQDRELDKITGANTILSFLSNGKARYSEIEKALKPSSSGLLDKYLKALCAIDVIGKTAPINAPNDPQKTFYEIKDNLTRFYYAYVFQNSSQLTNIGEDAFYESYVETSLTTFISYRFEEIARQYFSRLARAGLQKGIYDIGTYWYDDRKNAMNGEFDCVLKHKETYSFYECKFRKDPVALSTVEKEAEQIRKLVTFNVEKIGFISLNGFQFESNEYDLIEGKELFDSSLKLNH